MPDSIFVVEYEPRYIERVRQALAGYAQPTFAKDGEEALRVLQQSTPRLIVLSSIIPKISTAELIRKLRAMPHHQLTPILITVSGYNGRSPKADAVKLGATDILPKPYSEGEFLNKIKQLLESPAAPAPEATTQTPKMASPRAVPEPTEVLQKITPESLAGADPGGADDAARKSAAKARSSAELDKLLETTLSGLQTGVKRPASAPKPEARKASDFDKLLETTLSGLEVPRRPAVPPAAPASPPPASAPQPVAAPVPLVAPERTEQMHIPSAEELEAEKRRADELEAESQRALEAERKKVEAEARAAAVAAQAAPPPPGVQAGSVSFSSPVFAESAPVDEKVARAEDDGEGIPFGSYLLLEKIATGGMAEVWKARKRGVEGFQKIVAIKKILPHMSNNEEFLTMFVDEAKLAAQLNHNNIIHIYELGKIDESYFIAMEYVDGEDLKSIIRRGRETMQPMSVELALFVASKIAAALDYAHRKRGFDDKELGLVHRDVSPQNVLISHEGDIKLCDFGIAKAASKASHTIAGALKGKLQYMSPEQAWGRSIDRRSDIFALAAVLFEMLTSQKLFTGDNELSVLEQVREAKVRAASSINDEVPAEVDAIVMKALAREPEQRYQTAGEMGRDLEGVLYTFRPAPTSADLAIHMDRLFVGAPAVMPSAVIPEETPQAPEPEPEAFAAEPVALVPPPPAAPVVDRPPARVEPEPVPQPEPVASAYEAEVEDEKKFPVLPVAIAAVVLIAAIGGGAFLMTGGKPESGPQVAQASPTVAVTPVPPTDNETATELPDEGDLVDPEAATTDTAIDQALIDQEVQRRIETERLRLEGQRQQELKRAEEAAAQEQPARPASEPQVAAPPPATATPPPATPPPSTPPPATQPPPAAMPQPTTLPMQQPTAQSVKEGDFVAVGTPGLVAPILANFSKPVYPPLARRQRVEGVVVVQALITEKGEVLEAKVLRGVKEDVGINEAAINAIKRSTFTPATKDGVKVRSYYTGTIPFRL